MSKPGTPVGTELLRATNATWPFARIRVSSDRLQIVVNVWKIRKHSFELERVTARVRRLRRHDRHNDDPGFSPVKPALVRLLECQIDHALKQRGFRRPCRRNERALRVAIAMSSHRMFRDDLQASGAVPIAEMQNAHPTMIEVPSLERLDAAEHGAGIRERLLASLTRQGRRWRLRMVRKGVRSTMSLHRAAR